MDMLATPFSMGCLPCLPTAAEPLAGQNTWSRLRRDKFRQKAGRDGFWSVFPESRINAMTFSITEFIDRRTGLAESSRARDGRLVVRVWGVLDLPLHGFESVVSVYSFGRPVWFVYKS